MAQRTQVSIFTAPVGSGGSFVAPGSGSIPSIPAGSLVRFGFRYEGGASVSLSAVDSAGATYSVVQYTPNDSPSVAIFYKHNHPGNGSGGAATNVTITITLGAARSYEEVVGEVASGTVGEADPLTGTYGTFAATGGPASATVTGVTGDADLFMVVGSYSASTFTGSAGSTALHSDTFTLYSNAIKQHFTGAGDKTIASTGGAGATRALAVAFLDSGGAGGGGTPPGIATESDTALALAGKQIRALGMASETDAALALVNLAGLPFNTAPYEFGQRTGLDVADFSLYASTSLNVSVYAETDVLLASQLFAYTESTGTDGRLTRKTHASLTAGSTYIFVAVTAGGAMVAAGRITAT